MAPKKSFFRDDGSVGNGFPAEDQDLNPGLKMWNKLYNNGREFYKC